MATRASARRFAAVMAANGGGTSLTAHEIAEANRLRTREERALQKLIAKANKALWERRT